MLLLQLPRIHIGDHIAVHPRRRRQIQHKRRIQPLEHLDRQIRGRIVTLIHNDHRRELAQHLDQRRIRRIRQTRLRMRNLHLETVQRPILLIHLAHILLTAIDTQRIIRQDTHRELLPYRVR